MREPALPQVQSALEVSRCSGLRPDETNLALHAYFYLALLPAPQQTAFLEAPARLEG